MFLSSQFHVTAPSVNVPKDHDSQHNAPLVSASLRAAEKALTSAQNKFLLPRYLPAGYHCTL